MRKSRGIGYGEEVEDGTLETVFRAGKAGELVWQSPAKRKESQHLPFTGHVAFF